MSPADRLRRAGAGILLLARLSPVDRKTVLRAWTDLLVCRVKVSFPQATATRAFDDSGRKAAAAAVDHLLGLFGEAAATCVHGTRCLPRSLALQRFLRRYGAQARLRLGMRKTGAGWTGHAWLEREGRVVGDSEDFVRQFVPFRETA